ncbi:MAG TPA: SufE family protein [Bacteroidaceae bacterium]|nr:SufE family protein [Bacteroidaceae bacterium]
MQNIDNIQNEIIEEFNIFDDWMDKYQLIIDVGSEHPPINDNYKNDDNLIEGCQSRVWLHAEYHKGKVFFQADSDAIITKGLVALLIKVWSGQSPNDILTSNLYFIDSIGLKEHLSPTRSNGLLSMIKQMQMYALAFKVQEK